ncbi:flagellar hook-basal body complex protein FliE [Citrifermentans bemidjiense Bem]|uniref:Flagellar hook-basal body complex protein FliE n=1 Tax=Citrifermentans bemidjiense (strain ATCC BAA-1014 / DSM 16622 / JCM 12645 / Bem) TaxID=404380 RepID=B5EEP5_CITBB|nr:flagellar hook-basal body complex protein FliE [Citrifermentans bemidjiense]ACH40831.1 flagellar hook-basal body complex protein FliE [Citrifermentans bemidjiense Bem]
MEISALTKVSGLSEAFPAAGATGAAGVQQNPTVSFGNFLDDMVGKVGELQKTADQSIQGLATGESKGLHEVMLAVEKASISFQMLTQVRNKAVEAYQEIMRMPV